LPVVLLFELAFAGDGEGLVLDADIDVLHIDIRQIGLQDQLVFGFVDVDGGRPGPVGLGLGEHAGEGVLEEADRIGQCGSKWVRDMVEIFGGLVPFGKVWRAGANQATLLHTDLDLTIGELAVPKGDYSIYILPEEKQWTLIISQQTGQWGINHDGSTTDDPAKELGRVAMKLTKPAAPVETWTIGLAKAGNQGTLTFSWANTVATAAFAAK
jgi:hypothetical protein